MKNLVIAVFFFGTLVSCGALGTTVKTNNQPSLENSQWQLADQVKGKIPTLKIESGKVLGNAGCNNYFGELALDSASGSFSAKNLASTKMACSDMSTEDNFLNMLLKATHYRISGNTLELYQNSLLLLKFNKIQ